MRLKVSLSSFVCVLLLGVSLSAADLDQVVRDVVVKNPGIKSKISAYKQEVEAYKASLAEYRPTVDFEASMGREKTVKNRVGTNNSLTTKTMSLVARQNVFNGFATENGIKVQASMVYSVAYDYLGVANELALSAIELYLNIIREKELLALEKINYMTHEKIFEDVKKKYDSGLGKISDVKEVKSKLSLAYANYISQEQSLNDKVVQFNALYGDYIDVGSLKRPTRDFTISHELRDLEQMVIERNPNVLMKAFAVDAAKYTNIMARRGDYPRVDFELSKTKNYNQSGIEETEDTTNALFRLSYNLYNKGIDESNIQKSLSALVQRQEELSTRKQEEVKRVRLAYLEREMTSRKMLHLNAFFLSSKEKLVSYREEFDLGRRSLLDLLGAEEEYNSAQKQLVNAEYDSDIVHYKIAASIGKLLDIFGIDLQKGLVINGSDISLSTYKADVIVGSPDSDGDTIEDVKDLCFNSSYVQGNSVTGCSKTLDDFLQDSLSTNVKLDNVSTNKDLTGLSGAMPVVNDIRIEPKRYILKTETHMKDKIDGSVEYVWPKGVYVEGIFKNGWIEVSKRLGRKGEVLGEFKLWAVASALEEI